MALAGSPGPRLSVLPARKHDRSLMRHLGLVQARGNRQSRAHVDAFVAFEIRCTHEYGRVLRKNIRWSYLLHRYCGIALSIPMLAWRLSGDSPSHRPAVRWHPRKGGRGWAAVSLAAAGAASA